MLIKVIIVGLLLLPTVVWARVNPEDIYQAKRAAFEQNLLKTDQSKRPAVIQFDKELVTVNHTVCQKFDRDVEIMAAILEEVKLRQGITSTVVAFGRGETPLDQAAYYLNFAAEAVAYQKIQDYTPEIGGDLKSGARNSLAKLKNDLIATQNKVIKAKTELKKALDYYEK